ncbi:MAG: hypothetical protein HQM08_00765 [Candidatus Riflebacteria bacterium]|nr:hypothetical protein [Candidatus Riflebacteria bacterium]
MRKFFIYFSAIAALVGVSAFIYNLVLFHRISLQYELGTKQIVHDQTVQLADNLDKYLAENIVLADEIASEASSLKLPQEKVSQRLNKLLQDHPDIGAIGLAYYPIAFDQDKRKEQAFYFKNNSSDTNLIKIKESSIVQTHPDTGLPFVIGTVFIEISPEKLKEFLSKKEIGQNGYPFLFSQKGQILFHPRKEFMEDGVTLQQVAYREDAPELLELELEAIKRKSGEISIPQGNCRDRSTLFYRSIPSTSWMLVFRLIQPQMASNTTEVLSRLFNSIIGIEIFLLFFAVWIILHHSLYDGKSLWTISSLASIALFAGIAIIWYLVLNYFEPAGTNELPIFETSMVEQFKEDFKDLCSRRGYPPPIYLPTGVFVQSVDFQSGQNVKVTGFVWQRFHKKYHKDLTQEIHFPESVDSTIDKAYEREYGDWKLVGWRFKVELRQWFGYSSFPLDRENVWLRMWQGDIDKNVVLIPDLTSYFNLHPDSKPGLDAELLVPGWKISKSYFSLEFKDYNTNFGFQGDSSQDNNTPELYFNIIIKRAFLDPFISNLLPIFVVIVLMFISLLLATKNQDLNQYLGFNSSMIITIAASVFFVVVFAQIDLRTRLGVVSIIYFDLLYFLTYFLLLIVSIDTIIFSWTNKIHLIQFKDNLIAKISFWPFIFGSLFVMTAVVFYP